MTFVLIGLRRSGNFSLRKDPIKNVKNHALQALFPLRWGLHPARELLRKFRSPGLPPLLLPALQGGRMRGGGSRGAPGVASREASSPPARPRSSERGGSVSGRSSVACPLSLQLLRELQRGGLLVRSGTPLARAASSVASPRSSQHAPRRDERREASVDRSRSRSSRVSRSSDRVTRKDRRARSRSDSSRDRDHRSRSHSAYRSRLSVGGGRLLSRSPTANGRGVTGRDLWIAPAHIVCALALGETGLDPRIDTGLAETALSVTGRGLLTATDHVSSARVPLLAGEVVVTARVQAISLVVLVTARGLADDLLPPLTVRGRRREDGEPDVSGRRVWRR